MWKNILLPVLVILVFYPLTAQEERIPGAHRPDPERTSIPHKKYDLKNGLTVIVTPDHSTQVVEINLTYLVGSSHEETRQQGLAAFTEYMMFRGSGHVKPGQHKDLILESGGSFSSSTGRDMTIYREKVPKTYLETALWLESDRMGFLLETLTREKFQRELKRYQKALKKRIKKDPALMLQNPRHLGLYEPGHPYSHAPGIYYKNLSLLNVNDFRAFCLKWYAPNNAILTIGGDVKPSEVIKAVKKYFGDIPRGPETSPLTKQIPVLNKKRYVTVEAPVHFPRLQIVYPTVPETHQDKAALDVLAGILGKGKNSLLYKRLIDNGLSPDFSVEHNTCKLSGDLVIDVRAYPNLSLKQIEKAVQEAFKELDQEGLYPRHIQAMKNRIIAEKQYAPDSMHGKVEQLQEYMTSFGVPRLFEDEISRYREIRLQTVLEVFHRYFKGEDPLLISVVPEGQSGLKAGDENYKLTPASIIEPEKSTTTRESLNWRETPDPWYRWFRNNPPRVRDHLTLKVPDYSVDSLPSGGKLYFLRNSRSNNVVLRYSFQIGQIHENTERLRGLTYLLSKMLLVSTETFPQEKLAQEMQTLGTEIHIQPSAFHFDIVVKTQRRSLPPTLEMLRQVMFMQQFNPDKFSIVKKRTLARLKKLSESPSYQADLAFRKLIYGKGHPLAYPLEGTIESISRIQNSDLERFYFQYFNIENATVIASGDIRKDEIRAQMEFIYEDLDAGNVTPKLKMKPPESASPGVYFIPVKDAGNVAIRIGTLGMPYDATNGFYKARLMNHPLGVLPASRLKNSLEKETAHISSSFHGNSLPGPFTIKASTKPENAVKTIRAILKILKDHQNNKISRDLWKKTGATFNTQPLFQYNSPTGKTALLRNIAHYNLNADFTEKQATILRKANRSDIKDWAGKYLPNDKMIIVVAGNKNVEEKLQKLDPGKVNRILPPTNSSD